MSEVIIRAYRKTDCEAVLRITEESFEGFCMDYNMEQHFGRIAGTTWRERKRDGIQYELRRHGEHTLVAALDGEVVGYVCTRIEVDYATGHIANLAVAKAYQSRGIGKMLLRQALDHLRECGMRYARIETLEQNFKGRQLYPTFGFKEIGRQVYYLREL
jgi:ribosomal protein S18 acetylase RimI-like enzyme